MEPSLNTHFFNLQNVAGNDLWSLDLLQLAVTKNGGLESKSLFQFLDNRAGLEFLDETDAGIEQQQGANDTEIDPILETGSKDSGSLDSVLARFNCFCFVLLPSSMHPAGQPRERLDLIGEMF